METIDFKFMSYLIGLLQTDGHFSENTRNRGRISLELSIKDKDIIDKIVGYLPVNYSIKLRTRNTNFKTQAQSITLNIFDLKFRNTAKEWGLFPGKKSDSINVPAVSELDKLMYIRGLYDGDGSLGMTAEGFPFLSIVTKSEPLKDFLIKFIQETTGKTKNVNRNKRDNIYNICVYKEDAQKMCSKIYSNGIDIAIARKKELADLIISWERVDDTKKVRAHKIWSLEEDSILLDLGPLKAKEKLSRSLVAISLRYRFLKKTIPCPS
jgi:hypothetical protein